MIIRTVLLSITLLTCTVRIRFYHDFNILSSYDLYTSAVMYIYTVHAIKSYSRYHTKTENRTMY